MIDQEILTQIAKTPCHWFLSIESCKERWPNNWLTWCRPCRERELARMVLEQAKLADDFQEMASKYQKDNDELTAKLAARPAECWNCSGEPVAPTDRTDDNAKDADLWACPQCRRRWQDETKEAEDKLAVAEQREREMREVVLKHKLLPPANSGTAFEQGWESCAGSILSYFERLASPSTCVTSTPAGTAQIRRAHDKSALRPE